MSRPVTLTLLCEDLQTVTLIRYFFTERGWKTHDFRVLPLPCGKGSGEQYVREKLPGELQVYRSRHNYQQCIALIAAVDADKLEVQDRRGQLNQQCIAEGFTPPQPGERVMVVIPKRNIETWLAYLRGEPVNEEDEYPKYRGSESRCKPQAQRLNEMCQKGQLAPNPPDSLETCCRDFKRFWNLI
jgi:hypothetical protein